MEKPYNLDKTPSAEPSLKRDILPNSKRSKQFTFLPWRAQSDSLCGHFAFSSVQLKKENKFAFANKVVSISFQIGNFYCNLLNNDSYSDSLNSLYLKDFHIRTELIDAFSRIILKWKLQCLYAEKIKSF